MTNRDELLKQIRLMGKGTRGAAPAILDLPDATLYGVFEQMQRGLSNRAIARYLRRSGMKGSENSLQQTLSLFRKRIAPLLGEESATPSLPQAVVKLRAAVSSQPPDEILSTATDIVSAYGEWIKQETVAAVKNGTPLGEDMAKHVKAYSAAVATKARLEQTVVKQGGSIGPPEDRSFDELSKKALDFIGDDGDKMVKASQKFLMRIEKKCVSLRRGADGEWVEAPTRRPGPGGTGETCENKFSID
ncbi:MAG: hypothetical protein ACLP5H_18470 [Desulfomonilaceae bacterium]